MRPRGYWLSIVLATIGLLMVRPAVLGTSLTPAGLTVLTVAGLVAAFSVQRRRDLIPDQGTSRLVLATIWFWVYLFVLGMGAGAIEPTAKAFTANVLTVLVIAGVAAAFDAGRTILRLLIGLLAILAASYWITILLSWFFSLDSLFLFRLPIEGYGTAGRVYFPFTVLANRAFGPSGFEVYRFMSAFREPGIAQAFYLWALFLSALTGVGGRRIRLLLLSGVVACFSTVSLIVAPVTLALFLVVSNPGQVFGGSRKALALTALAVLVLAPVILFRAPLIGIDQKESTHAPSVSERLDALTQGTSDGVPLFGAGLYEPGENLGNSISLAGSVPRIGLVGLLFLAVIYLFPLREVRNRGLRSSLRVAVPAVPLLLTAALAQPLVDAPLNYAVLLLASSAWLGSAATRRDSTDDKTLRLIRS